jgi:hypothetical protein
MWHKNEQGKVEKKNNEMRVGISFGCWLGVNKMQGLGSWMIERMEDAWWCGEK